MSAAKNMVESLREVMQDLLVPELKAVKVSVEGLRTEMNLNNGAIREEMKLNNEAIREEIKLSNQAIREEIRLQHEHLSRMMQLSEERTQHAISRLSEKLDFNIEVRERLASLEARLPRQ